MPDTVTHPQPAPRPQGIASRPARELHRAVAADATPSRLALRGTSGQLFLRHNPTHENPHIVEDAKGERIARFQKDADLAAFLVGRQSNARMTLPEAYVFHLTGGQL